MYEQPSGMLSYVFVDQSIIHSIWAGLFLLPIWCGVWLLLFRLWQEDLWQEYDEWISLIQNSGFHCSIRPLWPYWSFSNGENRVALIGSPFGVRAYLWKKKERVRISTQVEEVRLIIDSLVQEGSISMPQSG